MTTTIGSNISSLVAQRMLSINDGAKTLTLERLSSGLRINRASDDAAGLAVSTSLSARGRVYSQSIRNANDGISALNIADAALSQLSDIATRLKELATSSANGSLGRIQRVSNDKEATALTDEFNRIIASTTFNGRALVNGRLGELALQLGFGSSERISARIGDELSRNVLLNYNATPTSTLDTIVGGVEGTSGDINNDGIVDLIAADDAGALYAHLGNGDGTFQSGVLVGASPGGLLSTSRLVDVNGDGRLDIIEANNDGFGSGGLYVAFGNGDGTFQASSEIYASALNSMEIGDLNGDGHIDIVAATTTGAVISFLGASGGTFGAAVGTGLTGAAGAGRLALGDLDGDGKLDIAYASGTNLVSARGTGTGVFLASTSVSAGATISAVRLADFNSDGILDAAAVSNTSIRTFTGNGNGTFGSATVMGSTGSSIYTVADINGDGIPDLLGASGSKKATAYYGRGDGTFTTAETFLAEASSLVADLNNDGVLDFISKDSHEVYLANTQQSTTIQRLNITTQQGAYEALNLLDAVMARLALERGAIGSTQSRLSSALASLTARVDNYAAANARITNADIASESAELARRDILTQVGISVLAQANQAPALALTLLG